MTYAIITRERPGRRHKLICMENGCPEPFTLTEARKHVADVEHDLRKTRAIRQQIADSDRRLPKQKLAEDLQAVLMVPWGSPRFQNAFFETYQRTWTSIPKPVQKVLETLR